MVRRDRELGAVHREVDAALLGVGGVGDRRRPDEHRAADRTRRRDRERRAPRDVGRRARDARSDLGHVARGEEADVHLERLVQRVAAEREHAPVGEEHRARVVRCGRWPGRPPWTRCSSSGRRSGSSGGTPRSGPRAPRSVPPVSSTRPSGRITALDVLLALFDRRAGHVRRVRLLQVDDRGGGGAAAADDHHLLVLRRRAAARSRPGRAGRR